MTKRVVIVSQLTMKLELIWNFKKYILIINYQKVIKIKSNSGCPYLMFFNEIEITGDNNWIFGAISFWALGDLKNSIMVKPIICGYNDAHRFRFKEFITERIATYLREWGRRNDG